MKRTFQLFVLFSFFLALSHAQAQYSLFPTVTCSTGQHVFEITYTGAITCSADTGGGGVPAGLITLSTAACPTGWTEVAGLTGKTLIGTTNAAGDAGTTGGSDNITPTVNSLTAAAQTFSGSALGTHLHGTGTYDNAAVGAGTPSGTNSTSSVTPLGTNSTSAISGSTGAGSSHTHSFTGDAVTAASTAALPNLVTSSTAGSAVSPTTTATGTNTAEATHTHSGSSLTAAAQTFTGSSSTVGAQTFTGNALATHDHIISGSSEAIGAGTPAGTNATSAVTGTLNSFDNRSAWMKVIFCSKD